MKGGKCGDGAMGCALEPSNRGSEVGVEEHGPQHSMILGELETEALVGADTRARAQHDSG